MIRILGREDSINVRKVLWCCEELGLAFEREDFGGPFGKTDTPEYLSLNPNGLVPTVLDDGLAVWESNTILRYLASKYGGEPLRGRDPAERSRVERWMDWQLSVVGPPMTVVFINLIRLPEDERDMAAVEKSRNLLAKAMTLLDGELGDGPYILGREFTLADIPLGVAVNRWFELPIRREKLDNLARYYGTLRERAGYTQHVANGIP
ncbi:MAG: glutathione S-transferase family protein [Rhodospirillales bacterium]|nr:MAG: glutathione S-transferase family protein [Rhodospirillales bacterium]